jgi:hypothetical protein
VQGQQLEVEVEQQLEVLVAAMQVLPVVLYALIQLRLVAVVVQFRAV